MPWLFLFQFQFQLQLQLQQLAAPAPESPAVLLALGSVFCLLKSSIFYLLSRCLLLVGTAIDYY
jgi:hypothetical protein